MAQVCTARPKIEGGRLHGEMVLNYPRTRAHPGWEVSCQRIPNQFASSLRPCFVEANPTLKKLYRATKRTDL